MLKKKKKSQNYKVKGYSFVKLLDMRGKETHTIQEKKKKDKLREPSEEDTKKRQQKFWNNAQKNKKTK